MTKNNSPSVSIIVPLRNDAAHIRDCLRSLLAQTYPSDRVEVLVVDGFSDDGSGEIVKELALAHSNIKYLVNKERTTPVAMNTGIAAAKNELLSIISSHSSLAPDYIETCVRLLQGRSDIDCVGGAMRTEGRGYIGRAIAATLSSPFGVGNAKFRTGASEQFVDTAAFGLYRRSVFDKVGVFDERLIRNQDNDFHARLRRLGGKILLTPQTTSYYYGPSNLYKFCRQAWRNGLWNLRLTHMARGGLSLRHFVPLLFVIGLLVCAAAAMLSEPRPLIFLASVYISTALVFSFLAAGKGAWTALPLLPGLFFLLHLSYGLGSLLGLMEWAGGKRQIDRQLPADFAIIDQSDGSVLKEETEISINAERGSARAEFLSFGAPRIEAAEIEEVAASMRAGWLVTGPKVARFQEMFKDYIGAEHALALNSCTAGLHLSLLVAGIGAGDEVITVPMTFASTANTIIHTGARPVFVDIERATMTMDPDALEAAITPATKAIVPVHFAGRPCRMDAIMKIAKSHGLIVIEDAAHAIEARYKGSKVGNIGDLTAFSFYVTKNLVTGEGGMVTTNNPEWAEKIQIYGLHGLSTDAWSRYSDQGPTQYEVVYPGYKYNMMDIQAAMGIHQLPRIEEYLKRREAIWQRYDEAFADLPVVTSPAPPEAGTRHARHLYTVLIGADGSGVSRDAFQSDLTRRNIGTAVHFSSLHLQTYYSKTFGYARGDFPNCEYVSDRTLSLPLSANLTDQDVGDVIRAVKDSVAQTRSKHLVVDEEVLVD